VTRCSKTASEPESNLAPLLESANRGLQCPKRPAWEKYLESPVHRMCSRPAIFLRSPRARDRSSRKRSLVSQNSALAHRSAPVANARQVVSLVNPHRQWHRSQDEVRDARLSGKRSSPKGHMWPTPSHTGVNAAEEAQIGALVKNGSRFERGPALFQR